MTDLESLFLNFQQSDEDCVGSFEGRGVERASLGWIQQEFLGPLK